MKRINYSLLAGLILGMGLIAVSILMEIGTNSARVFFHPAAILIVVGGTIAAALIAMPISELRRAAIKTYFAVRSPRNDFVETAQQIVKVSVGLSRDVMFLEKLQQQVGHTMLREGLQYISMGFKAQDIQKILEKKKEQNELSFAKCANTYLNLAKMGPAFGLLGTLVGLIVLLYYHMGSGDMEKVASSMGIALTATLYGVGISNLIFGPLGEYMLYIGESNQQLDEMVIQGTVLLKERKHPIYLVQELRAFVPQEDYEKFDAAINAELAILKSNGSTKPNPQSEAEQTTSEKKVA